VNYDRLTQEYWATQNERVRTVLQQILRRPQAVLPGRVVPAPNDLALGTGRALKAAVMFIDISGFSQRPSATSAQQEVLLRILNLFFSEMIRIAEEYGGTVEKNTGDGLMAYFEDNQGDPAERGTKRAVAAALSMMYTNGNLINPILTVSRVEPIQFRIGIDYGPITIAQLGAAKRFGGLVAIGASANIACKMLKEASPGDVLLGEDAYNELPTEWRTRFATLHREETGWVYLATGAPYRFYRYFGRWIKPV